MTAPAGIFGAQQADLQSLVVASATFDAECTASDDPVTANHIAIVADERWETPLPCAIICTSPDTLTDDYGFASGSNIVIFERLVEAELAETEGTTNAAEAFIRFSNFLGAVVSEMIDEAWQGGHLLNLRAQLISHPIRSERSEKDEDQAFVDYIRQSVKFTWGTR